MEKNARKDNFIPLCQDDFSAKDDSEERGGNQDKFLSERRIFQWLVWCIQNRWDKKHRYFFLGKQKYIFDKN
jgi:hypothetical protein